MAQLSIFWHRRDIRLEDNSGLYHALKQSESVQPIFIFDKHILDHLPSYDRRVDFIHRSLTKLRKDYQKHGVELWVFYGTPEEVFVKLSSEHDIKAVFTNRDYEPYAKKRDKGLYEFFNSKGIVFKGFKDQVIFEKNEVVKEDGKPYTVFSPYGRKWRKALKEFYYKSYPTLEYSKHLNQTNDSHWLELQDIGFEKTDLETVPAEIPTDILKSYGEKRNFPGIHGTTQLSVHLRFGTISIRHCVQEALRTGSDSWLNELIWRDFYHTILYHFPRVEESFKAKYEGIEWRNDEKEFKAWCEGRTGYPIVDAGMRELNNTGFMHNRVRMIVASFLCKHLLIDWRWGEAYFAEKLNDFDLAANNGGWQWASGSGCDAAPYFRVFNPYEQTKKFDKQLKYINKWIPELNTPEYPEPIVEHKFARQRALDAYKAGLDSRN